MVDGWMYYLERRVFVILKNKRKYSGTIIGIDDKSPPLIWISMIDKFGERVTFVHSEIELIQEEREEGK